MRLSFRTLFVLVLAACLLAWTAMLKADVPTTNPPMGSQAISLGYQASTVSSAYRSALDGGETFTDLEATNTTTTSAACVTTISVSGIQNMSVNAHMSAGSATVALTAVGYYVNGPLVAGDSSASSPLVAKIMHTTTLTGGGTFTEGSLYPSTSTWTFDTAGITTWKVFAADPSSGTATLYVEAH